MGLFDAIKGLLGGDGVQGVLESTGLGDTVGGLLEQGTGLVENLGVDVGGLTESLGVDVGGLTESLGVDAVAESVSGGLGEVAGGLGDAATGLGDVATSVGDVVP
jgi:hypothetical protein